MGFADAAKQGPPQNRRELLVDTILGGLDDTERKPAEQILRDPTWSHEALSRAFTDEGHPVSPSALYKWRKRNGVL